MSDINEVVHHVIFLHLDSTVDWHSCDDNYKTELIIIKYLNCDESLSVKFKHIFQNIIRILYHNFCIQNFK